jgi:hypothetical protein
VWRSRLLVLLLLLCWLPGHPAQAAGVCSAGVGVGLVDVPRGSTDPRATTYVIDHVKPGARFARRFQVCNGTAAPVTVQLYAGAAQVAGGTFSIVEGRVGNELSSWITVEPASVTVAPGQRVLATARFAVPGDAEAGERYGVLLAELPSTGQATGVRVASRVGVRVYLDVGPGGAPRSAFGVASQQASRTAPGTAQVTAQVHNTGARALDVTGSLSLRDGPGGLSGGPYAARLGSTLAPGETEPVLIPIDGSVASGPWDARLTLRSGLVERQVAAPLTFPDAPGAVGPAVDVEQIAAGQDAEVGTRRLLPLLLLPVLAAAGVVAVRRRRAP